VSSGEPRGHRSLRVPCLHNPLHDTVVAHLKDQQFTWFDFEGPSDEDLAKLTQLPAWAPMTASTSGTSMTG